MAFLDTLLIDAVDIRTLPYLRVVGTMNLFAPGDRRGENPVVPRRDGDRQVRLPRASYIVRVPVLIAGATRGERNDNLRTLAPLLGDGGVVTLTRKIATGSADDFDEHTAPGRFITGLSAEWINHLSGRTELQFYNTAGAWWDAATSTWLVP